MTNIRALFDANKYDKLITDSMHRLSTGNKQASSKDYVSESSIGSIMAYKISGIDAAMLNAAGANSMINTAMGAYTQIGQLIAEIQSIAAYSVSGAVSDSTRELLNAEAQDYIDAINDLANNTKFNDITLTDGRFSNATITTDSSSNATAASGILNMVAALADTEAISITVDSETVSFTGNSTGVFTHPLVEIDTTTYTTAALQATQIVSQINSISTYSGSDTTILNAKRILSKLSVTNSSSAHLTITALNAGTRGNDIIAQGTSTTAANLTLNGTNAANNAGLTLGGSATAGTTGALASGTFSTGTTAFSGTASTIATGTVGDSILTSLTTYTQSTTGIDVSGISNNADFTGTIDAFTATYSSANVVNISLVVGANTYTANGINTNFTSDTKITFSSTSGGFFQVQFSANNGSTVTNQTTANTYAARLNAAFSTINFLQSRSVKNYTAAGYVYPTGSTTPSGNLAGSSFTLINDDFNNLNLGITDIVVTPSASSNAVISITIDGEIYQSGYDYDGSSLSMGNIITSTSGSNSDGKIGFVSQTNPNHILIFQYADSSTDLSLTTQSEADGFTKALKSAFNMNNGADFQLSNNSSNVYNIKIGGATTSALFLDSNGVYNAISIDTQANAIAAQIILTNAIVNLTQKQTQLGSQENIISFTMANLESMKYNLDSARSLYQDTDISTETANLSKLMLQQDLNTFVLSLEAQKNRALLRLLDR